MQKPDPDGETYTGVLEEYDPEWDINVHLIQYDDDPEQPHVKIRLQPEKFKVKEVLNQNFCQGGYKESPLSKPDAKKKGLIRYFHFPANNMIVRNPFYLFSSQR